MHFVRKYPSSQTTSAKTIAFLKEIFAEQGIPEVIRSDNGRQYDSTEFAAFCKEWNIRHITSSPMFPQSNGFAEAMVKIIKGALQRAKHSGTDLYLALLDLRAMPIDTQPPSPAELLNQRRLRTTLPCKIPNTDPAQEETCNHLEDKKDHQKETKDKHARPLAPLYSGQAISWYSTLKRLWLPATIICKQPHNSYLIKTPEGNIYRRTCQHLRERQLQKGRETEREVKGDPELHPRPPWKFRSKTSGTRDIPRQTNTNQPASVPPELSPR